MGVVELKVREWRPDSWRLLPATRTPAYPEAKLRARVAA